MNELTSLWVEALAGYVKDRTAVMRLLPLMAAAHMLEDLPVAIFQCPEVTKDEYDAVFLDIITCVDEIRSTFGIGNSLWIEILRQFKTNSSIVNLATTITFNVALAIGWFPHILRLGIKKMRDTAWANAQARRLLDQDLG